MDFESCRGRFQEGSVLIAGGRTLQFCVYADCLRKSVSVAWHAIFCGDNPEVNN